MISLVIDNEIGVAKSYFNRYLTAEGGQQIHISNFSLQCSGWKGGYERDAGTGRHH